MMRESHRVSESMIWTAFGAGLFSACSLPLGAITSMLWRPSDRALSFLMAFGGGALLAALTIDLVASALARGHFTPLAVGSIGGGLLFIGLNEIVNDYGGFLRKASTTLYHLRRRDHVRFRRLLSNLQGVDFLSDLEDRDYRELARAMYSLELEAGRIVFDRGDPSDSLHIIEDGSVDLMGRGDSGRAAVRAGAGEAFGRRAFLAGTPHSRRAVTRSKTSMLVLPRRDFIVLLENSRMLRQKVHRALRESTMLDYLIESHHLDRSDAESRIAESAQELYVHGSLREAVPVERHEEDFVTMADRLQRLPPVRDLPESELDAIGCKLLYKRYRRGDAIFHAGELAERLYIVHEGEVTLLSPREVSRRGRLVDAGSAFGGLSFLTGGRHTVGAIAAEDTAVWELTRTDLEESLHEAPGLRKALADYLHGDQIRDYLVQAQGLDRDRVARWMGSALTGLGDGRLPSILRIQPHGFNMAHGAALAIWLGILLDGIPESFVIGAGLIERGISFSLIAGLFLSNFPEALSSSVGMREQGFSQARILIMWTSLMVITGLGAALGGVLLAGTSHSTLSLVEGVAAGAMLTMIAQTMLPEAYFRGGNIIGFATLMGFLAAIFFNTLQ
jgi:CRP-like cAMP-binding protein